MVPHDRIELPYPDYKTGVIPVYEKGKIGAMDENRTRIERIDNPVHYQSATMAYISSRQDFHL